jgi:hypothetical protein
MKLKPKSEREIAEDSLLPKGDYSFEVASAENKTSKSGNEMIELKLHVFDDGGDPRILFDYLLESMPRKLRHAAEACGLVSEYDMGSLDAIDFVGKTGTIKVGIQKDKAGQYPDRNSVYDYVAKSAAAAPQGNSKVPSGLLGEGKELNDEIPF